MYLDSAEGIEEFLKGVRKPNEEPMVFDDRRSYEEAINFAEKLGSYGEKLLEALIEFGKS